MCKFAPLSLFTLLYIKEKYTWPRNFCLYLYCFLNYFILFYFLFLRFFLHEVRFSIVQKICFSEVFLSVTGKTFSITITTIWTFSFERLSEQQWCRAIPLFLCSHLSCSSGSESQMVVWFVWDSLKGVAEIWRKKYRGAFMDKTRGKRQMEKFFKCCFVLVLLPTWRSNLRMLGSH